MNDFKYEFDLKCSFDIGTKNLHPLLFFGYVYLHQFVKQDLINGKKDYMSLFTLIKDSLDGDESITIKDDIFELKLKEINTEIIDYVSFLIKYSLVLINDFNINYNNNTISWRIDNED